MNNKRLFGIILFAAIFFIITMIAVNSSARTITVDDSGGMDYTTIQAAVNASNASDTVYIYNGVYSESVAVNKSISIAGESTQAIIRGANVAGSKGIAVTASNVSISNLKLEKFGYGIHVLAGTNNSMSNISITECDSCIGLFSSTGNIVSDVVMTDCTTEGICIVESSGNTISRVTITDCSYDGIYASFSPSTTITNASLTRCAEGIYLAFCSNSYISHSSVTKSNLGIGIAASTGVTLRNSTFSNNSYGIDIYSASNNNIYYNTFTNNTIQAYDNGANNWDDGAKGNMWDDYTGKDVSGVGDVAYSIPGGNCKDNKPITAGLVQKSTTVTAVKSSEMSFKFTWNTTIAVNLVLCAAIVALGLWGYIKKKDIMPVFIGAAFGLFGISHLATLTISNQTELVTNTLIVVRTLAYLVVIFVLYLFLVRKAAGENRT
ncbi:MAG: NosD domain-containing protein [Thermoplasmata archaeon]